MYKRKKHIFFIKENLKQYHGFLLIVPKSKLFFLLPVSLFVRSFHSSIGTMDTNTISTQEPSKNNKKKRSLVELFFIYILWLIVKRNFSNTEKVKSVYCGWKQFHLSYRKLNVVVKFLLLLLWLWFNEKMYFNTTDTVAHKIQLKLNTNKTLLFRIICRAWDFRFLLWPSYVTTIIIIIKAIYNHVKRKIIDFNGETRRVQRQ